MIECDLAKAHHRAQLGQQGDLTKEKRLTVGQL
jgi:hypothetical protein